MGHYAEDTDLLTIEKVVATQSLVVYNDEVNTFDWVIKALMEVCNHTAEQAEQCSLFIHYKGKYAVKQGAYGKLKPLKEAIVERGIKAAIE